MPHLAVSEKLPAEVAAHEPATRVACFTMPGPLRLMHGGKGYKYRTIIGAATEEDSAGDIRTGAETSTFFMPPVMAGRLLECIRAMQVTNSFNCHKFSRVMAGAAPPLWGNGREPLANHEPLATPSMSLSVQTAIDIGAVGVVGASFPRRSLVQKEDGIMALPHSVVGLGSTVPQSLQVAALGGELGIVDNDELLNFYRSIYPQSPQVELLQVPPPGT